MPTTKDKLEFALLMGRHTRATLRQVQALMRYAGTLQRIAEQMTSSISPGQLGLLDKRDHIREHVLNIIEQWNAGLDGSKYFVNIQNHPAADMLKIRVSPTQEITVPA